MKTKSVLLSLVLTCLLACEKQSGEQLCFAPNCGELVSEKFNITILFRDSRINYESIYWVVGNTKFTLYEQPGLTDSKPREDENVLPFSCWKNTDLFPSNSLINKIQITRSSDNQVYELKVHKSEITTSAIIITVKDATLKVTELKSNCDDTVDF